MKKKEISKKKKLVLLIVGVIGLVIMVSSITLLLLKKMQDKRINDFSGFTFKEVENLNYGNYNLDTFVSDDIKCNENVCKLYNKKIDYEFSKIDNLGMQDFVVNITYNGKKYTKTYNLTIVDTEKPVIKLSSNEVKIALDSEFDAKSYLISVSDNYDKDLKDKVVIEGEVDTHKLGEYKVIYKVSDSSNNTDEKELIFKVVEKVEEEEQTDSSESGDSKPTTDSNTSSSDNRNNHSGGNTSGNNGGGSSTSGFKAKVNSIGLSPLYTRYPSLDNKISGILGSIINNGMSNYDKLMAIYNYVQEKLYYNMPYLDMNLMYNLKTTYHYTDFDVNQIVIADTALKDGYGVCDSYAALFMIMTRQAGFNSYVFGGQVKKSGGGTTGHAWVAINVGGTYYMFDPQIEDYGTTDTYFGKTSSELNIYTYDFNSNINKFNYFRETSPSTTSINITGLFNHSGSITTYNGGKKDASLTTTLGSNNTININVKMAGTGDYDLVVNVSKDGGPKQNLHSAASRCSDNENVTYTFTEPGNYVIEISTNDYGAGANNLYYVYLFVKNPDN